MPHGSFSSESDRHPHSDNDVCLRKVAWVVEQAVDNSLSGLATAAQGCTAVDAAKAETYLTMYWPLSPTRSMDGLGTSPVPLAPGQNLLNVSREAEEVFEARMMMQRRLDQARKVTLEFAAAFELDDMIADERLFYKGAWEAEPCPCCGRTCLDADNRA